MFMLDLFSWWYGSGWAGVLASTRHRFADLAETFSVRTLVLTLFSPWRRIITYPGASIEAKLRAIGDNLVSRFVGFMVRFFVLLAAAISFLFLCLAGVLELVLWPLIPFIAVALIIKGIL